MVFVSENSILCRNASKKVVTKPKAKWPIDSSLFIILLNVKKKNKIKLVNHE